MSASTEVVAVVAARDEADRIAATIAALRAFCDRVIVADDGSLDGTGAVAATAGAAVIRRSRSAGKGAAMEAGLAVAGDARIYVLADADLGASASSVVGLLAPVRAGDADIAVGVLPAGVGGGFGLVRRLSAGLIRLAGGPSMAAPMSGQRACTAAALAAVRPLAAGFGVETAMGIDAARAGLRVLEVPIAATHRGRGRSVVGFAHRARQGLHLLRAALPRLLRRGRPALGQSSR